MKTLTKAEEEVMQLLWQIRIGSINNLLEVFDEPKPAYNTISTIIRILENKGFVGHEQKGRGYLYFPKVSKEVYTDFTSNKLADAYFGGSFKRMVSFFVENEKLNLDDLEDILKNINK